LEKRYDNVGQFEFETGDDRVFCRIATGFAKTSTTESTECGLGCVFSVDSVGLDAALF
jgi:hypothetical protein